MLVFLYSGLDKYEIPSASNPTIDVKRNEIYKINYKVGMFLIAYPKRG